MKKIIVLLFFIVSCQLKAQKVKVLDLDTGLPIENVLVQDKTESKRYFSDVNGWVNLDDFAAKEHLFFSHLAFVHRRLTKTQIKLKDNVVYLTRSSRQLEEVVLSVSKWEQQKKDIPHKIKSISAEAIGFMGAQTAADVLGKSGHVFVQKSQLGGGSPMIRGFATNRVLISVDGVRMNNAIFRGGNVQNVIAIDPYTIKNTEVIFGPGSVIFGSDAMGGVMNFYTKEASLSVNDSLLFNGAINARYASANQEKTINGSVNIGGQQWASITNFTFSDFEDLKMGNYGPNDFLRPTKVESNGVNDQLVVNANPRLQSPSGYHQYSIFQKFRYVPSEKLDMSLGFHFSETSDYDRYDRLLEFNGDTPKYGAWYYGPQQWLMTNFSLTRQSESNLHDALKVTAAYQKFKESRHDRKYQQAILRNRFETVDAISFNADFEKKIDKRFKFFYGAEYVYNKIHSSGHAVDLETGSTSLVQSRYPDGATWQTIAAYINSEYKPRENLTLLAGLRYSHVFATTTFDTNFYDFTEGRNRIENGALTGSIGLSWFPGNSWQITLNGATGFRSPNIDDLGKVFDSEPGAVVVPNLSLEPEYAYNSELGIKKNFNNKVFVSGVAFYTHVVDALVRRDFALNGQTQLMYDGTLSKIQAIQNAARAYVYGLELGLDVYFNTNLSWLTNFTFNKGEEELEDGSLGPLRHAAPLFMNSHLVWKNHKLKLDLFANYNGEISFDKLAMSERSKTFIYAKDANGNPYAPKWYTLNFKTEYRLNKHLKSLFAFENITNQRYKPYASGIAAPGANVILGATYNF